MQFKIKENLWVLALIAGTAALCFFAWQSAREVSGKFAGEAAYTLVREMIFPPLAILCGMLSLAIFTIQLRFQNVRRTQSWLINVVRVQGERINALCPNEKQSLTANVGVSGQAATWPWGNHHTEYLGHLEAAARRYWVLYEPSDPTTAPTNDTVSEWLQTEHGISKEKARAIASMLRPDGLPTGPRR